MLRDSYQKINSVKNLQGLCPRREDDSFFKRLPDSIRIYCVGGAVRDFLLGKNFTDKDFLLVGADLEHFKKYRLKAVGKNFPVFLHPETNEELALARREKKHGIGYKGFIFFTGKDISLEEDLKRRDLTINAMAVDELGNLHDPFQGMKDLSCKSLKHVHTAFVEDPLRLIRLGRFLSQLNGFSVHDSTYKLCRQMVKEGEILTLSKERIWVELAKGLKAQKPINMVNFLLDCGAWEQITGSSEFDKKLCGFLKNLEVSKVSLEWIAAAVFQNFKVRNIHCKFPKAVVNAITVLNKSRISRKKYIDKFSNQKSQCDLILDIFETASLFRNPENLDDFLYVSFFSHPEHKTLLTDCFKFLSKDSLKPVIDCNQIRQAIKSEIRDYRLKRLKEFLITRIVS